MQFNYHHSPCDVGKVNNIRHEKAKYKMSKTQPVGSIAVARRVLAFLGDTHVYESTYGVELITLLTTMALPRLYKESYVSGFNNTSSALFYFTEEANKPLPTLQ